MLRKRTKLGTEPRCCRKQARKRDGRIPRLESETCPTYDRRAKTEETPQVNSAGQLRLPLSPPPGHPVSFLDPTFALHSAASLISLGLLVNRLGQVGRYYTSQKYANHWDAFDLNTEDGRRFAQNGGQRVGTVLVYLNDVASGGCTAFPQLGIKVQPKKGGCGEVWCGVAVCCTKVAICRVMGVDFPIHRWCLHSYIYVYTNLTVLRVYFFDVLYLSDGVL